MKKLQKFNIGAFLALQKFDKKLLDKVIPISVTSIGFEYKCAECDHIFIMDREIHIPLCPDCRLILIEHFAYRHKESMVTAKENTEKLQAEQKYPYCPTFGCGCFLAKITRPDRMDSDHWYFCIDCGWIYGDCVEWATEKEMEEREND